MKPFLKPIDVAKMLGISTKRLATMRANNMGPRYIQIGDGDMRLIRYLPDDVEKWIVATRSKSIDFG